MELNFNKKNKKTCKLGTQEFKVNQIIKASEKEYILETIYKSFVEQNEENEILPIMLTTLYGALDTLIIATVTDVDIQDVPYETLLESGFIDIVKKAVINYEDIVYSMNSMLSLLYLQSAMPKTENIFDSLKKLEDTKENKDQIIDLTNKLKDMNNERLSNN